MHMPSAKNLMGRKFGRLTVLDRTTNIGTDAAWRCRCDCGNEKAVAARRLKIGGTASCGCLVRENGSAKLKNIIGHRFSKLVVVGRCGSAKAGNAKWICQCDCGKQTIVTASALRAGRTESCGCLKGDAAIKMSKDIAGARFGKLTALERLDGKGRNGALWICQCDCGKFIRTPLNNLTGANTKSCGCMRAETLRDNAEYEAAMRAIEDVIAAGTSGNLAFLQGDPGWRAMSRA
jgi:hypothetical protein